MLLDVSRCLQIPASTFLVTLVHGGHFTPLEIGGEFTILLAFFSREGADNAMPDHPDRILRLTAVLERTGLTRSTLYRKMTGGSFPKNVAISTRCTGWRESAVNKWIRNPMFYSVEDFPDT